MTYLSLTLTAIGLAMDAVAVAIASGLSVKDLKLSDAFKMAAVFGAFQALMPLLGYLLASWFTASNAAWLKDYDHWIAFILLGGIGIKMILDARTAADEKVHSPFRTNKLIVLGIATSLDAFAVGVTFSLMEAGLAATVIIIGVITFLLCLPAVWFGARLGKLYAKRAEILGGVVLIGIGSKILIEHLMNGI
jgi:manganese efflux pump family protein